MYLSNHELPTCLDEPDQLALFMKYWNGYPAFEERNEGELIYTSTIAPYFSKYMIFYLNGQ